jgi:16S rRNA (uracil1498-N3)-methyltransferase
MNLLLLEPDQLDADGRARLTGAALVHVREVLGKTVGSSIKVGVRGGMRGRAEVLAFDEHRLELACVLDEPPPYKRPIELVLALPRPPVLRRVLQHVTAMGVRRIVLCHSARVEKSYWSSPAVTVAEIDANVRLGLEQACDTVAPLVETRLRLRPFVEDELAPRLDARRLVADPSGGRACPCDVEGTTILAIGPEGGWVPFELGLWADAGFEVVHLGPRILRVETAVIAALARLG